MLKFKKLKENDTGIEYLPEVPDDLDEITFSYSPTSIKSKLYALYMIIAKEQNYWQVHTATAYGNPDYDRLHGQVQGFCAGAGFNYDEDDEYIYIKNYYSTRTLMIIEKPRRRDTYYEEQKELKELLGTIL